MHPVRLPHRSARSGTLATRRRNNQGWAKRERTDAPERRSATSVAPGRMPNVMPPACRARALLPPIFRPRSTSRALADRFVVGSVSGRRWLRVNGTVRVAARRVGRRFPRRPRRTCPSRNAYRSPASGRSRRPATRVRERGAAQQPGTWLGVDGRFNGPHPPRAPDRTVVTIPASSPPRRSIVRPSTLNVPGSAGELKGSSDWKPTERSPVRDGCGLREHAPACVPVISVPTCCAAPVHVPRDQLAAVRPV